MDNLHIDRKHPCFILDATNRKVADTCTGSPIEDAECARRLLWGIQHRERLATALHNLMQSRPVTDKPGYIKAWRAAEQVLKEKP